MDEDSLLNISLVTALLDNGSTLAKLYTQVSPDITTFFSKHSTLSYLQLKLGLEHCTTFPMLCIHLSIRDPITSRIPLRVCLRLCIRYNYPIVLANVDDDYLNDSLLVEECCSRVKYVKNENIDIMHASTALSLLGKQRTTACLENIATEYTSGVIQCLYSNGLSDQIMSVIGNANTSEDRENMLSESLECLTTSVTNTIGPQVPVLFSIARSHYSYNQIVLLNLMRHDLLEIIKQGIKEDVFSIKSIVSFFDSLYSDKVFDWLVKEHGYGIQQLNNHHYPYIGSCWYSLKKLYNSDQTFVPSTKLIKAIVESDDVEALVWMRDVGLLQKVTFTMLRYTGITQEIIYAQIALLDKVQIE